MKSSNSVQILFVSATCSASKYDEIQNKRSTKGLDPSQRMFSAFLAGLSKQDCAVCCLTVMPYSSSNVDQKIFRQTEETTDNIRYVYMGFINIKVLRILSLYVNTIVGTLKWIWKTRRSHRVVLCDSLVYMCSQPARLLAKLFGIKTIAYVTDYPSLATTIKCKTGFLRQILQQLFDSGADKDLKNYDGYILVSVHMKGLIQQPSKPVIVVEDMIISPKEDGKEKSRNDGGLKKIMYGGALCPRFGVNKLVDAVHRMSRKDISLELYGSGESIEYIEAMSKIDSRIHYCGIVSFDSLLQLFETATLLINPRPSDEVFAAYSFPSKTLSYMLSKTPVLTTRIPGIPQDYNPYLFFFNREDAEDMSRKIDLILSEDAAFLREKGHAAYQFVVSNKNCLTQAERIYHFIHNL